MARDREHLRGRGPEAGEDLPLADRVVLVTGGGWNLGRAVAEACAAAGASVMLAGRRAELLEAAADGIRSAGGVALAAPADCADPDRVEELVLWAETRLGPIDCCAALAGGAVQTHRLEEFPPAVWDEVFRANVRTAFVCARSLLPRFRRLGRGSLLFAVGGGAFHPEPTPGLCAYAAAKAAVARLTDQLTAENLDAAFRVNALEPGTVKTDAQRAAAAALAVWMLSDASAPLRGRCLSVHDEVSRDAAGVARIEAAIHRARLRRCAPDAE